MVPAVTRPERATRSGSWIVLVAIGLVATMAGLYAPQMLPGDTPPPAPTSTAAQAGGDLSYSPPAWPEPPSIKGLLLRLGLGTALVLGLSVATLWYGKRWLQNHGPNTTLGAELRLVETLHLGGRCCLHLVQLSSRQVLVGADASGIKTVVPLPDAFEKYLTEAPAEPAVPAGTAS